MHKETQNKIELINKYFKKDNNIIELSLINYEGYNIYIRLDELKSTKTFKLSWFDLDLILDKNMDKYISSEYIPKDKIDKIDKMPECPGIYIMKDGYDNIIYVGKYKYKL